MTGKCPDKTQILATVGFSVKFKRVWGLSVGRDVPHLTTVAFYIRQIGDRIKVFLIIRGYYHDLWRDYERVRRAEDCRLIIAAANPAPNPLSILTTVSPDAHELSMASRAACPPAPAP